MNLCTNCNAPVKPVVALDIDGTQSAYHGPLIRFAAGYFGKFIDDHYDGSCPLHEWMDVSKDQYRAMKLAYRQGGMKRVQPPLFGASTLSSALSLAGIEVWMTTTRPYNRFDSTDPDTREWLRRHVGEQGKEYQGLIYDDDKYERLVEIVGADRIIGVVEDLPDQFERALALGLRPMLVHREHNAFQWAALPAEDKVETLHVAGSILVDRAKEWHEAHV